MIKVDCICCMQKSADIRSDKRAFAAAGPIYCSIQHHLPSKPVMIAPAEAITIVLPRTEEDILAILDYTDRLIAQRPPPSVNAYCLGLAG